MILVGYQIKWFQIWGGGVLGGGLVGDKALGYLLSNVVIDIIDTI